MGIEKSDDYRDVGKDFSQYLEHSLQKEVEELFIKLIRAGGPLKRVLDVGCASGRTSAFCKRHGVEELVGLEIDPRAVVVAKQHLNRVIEGDVSELELDYPQGYFDMLFFTDILEHLVDPWAQLKRYLEYLKPGGFVIVSLPNVGHLSVVWDLLSGFFTYKESGILDNGHLRFFTQDTAIEMLQGAGLTILDLVYRIDEESWQKHKGSNKIGISDRSLAIQLDPNQVSPTLKKTYFVRKFNFLACKR